MPDRLGIDRCQTRLSTELQANLNKLGSGIDQGTVEVKQYRAHRGRSHGFFARIR